MGSKALEALIHTFLSGTLILDGATISVHGNTVTITGTLPLFDHDWPVSAAIVAGPSLTFTLKATPPGSGSIDLSKLAGAFLPVQGLPLPALTVSGLTFQAGPVRSVLLHADLTGSWSIPVGASRLEISMPSLSMEPGGSGISGSIGGKLTIAGMDLTAAWTLPDDFHLDARVASLDLSKALADLAGSVLPKPPGFPYLTLRSGTVSIAKDGDDYTFFMEGDAVTYGAADIEVQSGPRAVVAYQMTSGWNIGELAGLKQFDSLELSRVCLALASFTDPSFTFPRSSAAKALKGVVEGVTFYADLAINSGALGVVGKLLDVDTAKISGVISSDPSKTELTATAGGNIKLIPGIDFTDVRIVLKPEDPPSVTLDASADVTIGGDHLTFTLDTIVSPDDVSFSLSMDMPWVKPFGLHGLTLETVILAVKLSPDLAIGVYGELDFGDNIRVRVGVQFVDGDTPDFLSGELNGTVTLTQIIKAFTGIRTLNALNGVSLSNFKVCMVDNPAGVTIGSLSFPPGFSFHGTVDFFGLRATAAMNVSPSGIKASGSISKISLGGMLTITNSTGNAGPSFSLDTSAASSSPAGELAGSGMPSPSAGGASVPRLLSLSGKASLMGLSDSVSGSVSDTGFNFSLNQSLNVTLSRNNVVNAGFGVMCIYKDGTELSGSGYVNFRMKLAIGPVILPGTNISLGTIHLDYGFSGSISLSLGDTNFKLSVTATINWDRHQLTMPELCINVPFMRLADLPGKIVKHIEKEAWDIFKSLLGDADKLFAEAEKGLVILGDDIDRGLKDYYNVTAKDTTTLLKGAGWTASQVAAALKNVYKKTADETASLLRGAGYGATATTGALNTAYNVTGNAASQALKGADYAASQVSGALSKAGESVAHTSESVVLGHEPEGQVEIQRMFENQPGGWRKKAGNIHQRAPIGLGDLR